MTRKMRRRGRRKRILARFQCILSSRCATTELNAAGHNYSLYGGGWYLYARHNHRANYFINAFLIDKEIGDIIIHLFYGDGRNPSSRNVSIRDSKGFKISIWHRIDRSMMQFILLVDDISSRWPLTSWRVESRHLASCHRHASGWRELRVLRRPLHSITRFHLFNSRGEAIGAEEKASCWPACIYAYHLLHARKEVAIDMP